MKTIDDDLRAEATALAKDHMRTVVLEIVATANKSKIDGYYNRETWAACLQWCLEGKGQSYDGPGSEWAVEMFYNRLKRQLMDVVTGRNQPDKQPF